MKFEGTVNINAPQEEVFAHLTDPDFVSQCAPGVESVEVVEPGRQFKVVATLGLGSVRSRFTVEVTFEELVPPEYARLKARGNTPGSATEFSSDMRLAANENSTTDLHWTAEVAVVGQIANLASRLLGGVSKKMSADFFTCVKSKIEAAPEVKEEGT